MKNPETATVVELRRERCFLCDEGAFPDPPHGLSYRDHAYLYGLADGVRAARGGPAPLLCKKHRGLLDEALAAKGLRITERDIDIDDGC